ncbi:MAG: class B sortase [Bacillota bacterium]|nr:class B sortase [Bacillota bacterium]
MSRKRLVLILILAGILAFSLFRLVSIWQEYEEGDAIYEEARSYVLTEEMLGDDRVEDIENPHRALGVYVDIEGLREENPEVLGWLLIKDTPVDYPLLQGEDNSYYLNHTYNNAWNSLGSIFLDCRAAPDLSDLHSIIYGHNTKNNSQFGSLRKLRDQSYYEEHSEFYVLLEDGYLTYAIFSVHRAHTLSEVFQTDSTVAEEHQAFLDFALEQSVIESGIEVLPTDRIVTLSTCTGNDINERLVVHGVLVEDSRQEQ